MQSGPVSWRIHHACMIHLRKRFLRNELRWNFQLQTLLPHKMASALDLHCPEQPNNSERPTDKLKWETFYRMNSTNISNVVKQMLFLSFSKCKSNVTAKFCLCITGPEATWFILQGQVCNEETVGNMNFSLQGMLYFQGFHISGSRQ